MEKLNRETKFLIIRSLMWLLLGLSIGFGILSLMYFFGEITIDEKNIDGEKYDGIVADTFYEWNSEVPMDSTNALDDEMYQAYVKCIYQNGTFRYFPVTENYECLLPDKSIIVR